MTKTIILGLGLSGLSFYDNLKNKDNVIAIEKNSEVGGYTRTMRIDRFAFDYTGHFLHLAHFKHPSTIGSLGKKYKDKWDQIQKTSCVYIDGQFCEAPYQYNFGQLGVDHARRAVESYQDRKHSNNGSSLKEI